MRLISVCFWAVGLVGVQAVQAQVFKCTEADGKTVYSQAPCTKADNKEKVVKLMDTPLTDSTPSEGKSGGYYQGANPAPDAPAKSYQTPTSNRLRPFQQTPVNTGPSNQQLIAECEASKGARCSSAAEIAYRRQEQRTPSAQEQANIQAAIRARREREQAERERAFFRR
jgi:hypothetical protein